MRTLRAWLPLACLLGNVAGAEIPQLDFRLGATHPGPGPFGVRQRSEGDTLRVYPGQVAEFGAVAALSGATIADLDNAHLIPQLQWCLMTGQDHGAEINAGSPLSCGEFGAPQLAVSAINDGIAQLHAVIQIPKGLPTGSYTLVATLNNPALSALFGEQASRALRSSPMLITTGPTVDTNEELSKLYWEAEALDADEDWDGVLSTTTTLLATYPSSVLALELKGDALTEKSDNVAARAAYTEALRTLYAGEDVRTPELEDAQIREMHESRLKRALAALQ